MTFKEILEELYEKTNKLRIYACRAWDSGVGIRAAIASDLYNDLIIDNMVFMICGDAYDKDYKRIDSTKKIEDGLVNVVHLRANLIPYGPITGSIELGEYAIDSMEVYSRMFDGITPEVIKLEAHRK